MHWGLPEESTEGLMDLLSPLLEISVAGQVLEGSPLEQTTTGETQRQILESKKGSHCWSSHHLLHLHTIGKAGYEAREVLQVLMLHQMQHSRLSWEP